MRRLASSTRAVPFAPCAVLVLLSSLAGCDSDDDGIGPADGPVPMDDPPPAAAVIDRDNHVALLAQVFAVYVGDVFDERIESIHLLATGLTGGADGHDSMTSEHACLNGGTVRVDAPDVFVFDDCQIGESLYAGPAEAPFARFGLVTSSEGLSIRTEPERSIAFSGRLFRRSSNTINDNIGSFGTTAVDYRTVEAGDTFIVEDADTRFSFGRNPGFFDGRLEGGFTLRSSLTGDRALEAMTTEPFVYPTEDISATAARERNFTSGTLTLSAADGNTLVFDVGNADEDSVAIALTVDGETETFTQPWSLWPDVRYADR